MLIIGRIQKGKVGLLIFSIIQKGRACSSFVRTFCHFCDILFRPVSEFTNHLFGDGRVSSWPPLFLCSVSYLTTLEMLQCLLTNQLVFFFKQMYVRSSVNERTKKILISMHSLGRRGPGLWAHPPAP